MEEKMKLLPDLQEILDDYNHKKGNGAPVTTQVVNGVVLPTPFNHYPATLLQEITSGLELACRANSTPEERETLLAETFKIIEKLGEFTRAISAEIQKTGVSE